MSEQLEETGEATISYRLVVEGWPVEWATSEHITHDDNRDGRLVIPGLLYPQEDLTERIVLQEALCQVGGFKFQIVATEFEDLGTTFRDNASWWLSRESTPVDMLSASLDTDDTNITTLRNLAFAEGTILHFGTEAVRVGTWPAITRHIWDTQPQGHLISAFNRAYDVPVFEGIPSDMEGRRCYLYRYDDQDDPAGDGDLIWRGMVTRNPYNERGVWTIDTQSILALWNQNLAGAIEEAHVVGIYHHWRSAFAFRHSYDGVDYPVEKLAAFALSEEELFAGITTKMRDALTASGADAYIADISIARGRDGGMFIQIRRSSDSAAKFFGIWGGSPILGWFSSAAGWSQGKSVGIGAGDEVEEGVFVQEPDELAADEVYYTPIQRTHPISSIDPGFVFHGAPASPLGFADQLAESVRLPFSDDSVKDTLPAHLIVVDQDLSGAETVLITGTAKPSGIYRLESAGQTSGAFFITVPDDWHNEDGLVEGIAGDLAKQGFLGFLGADTTITALRQYGTGNIATFVAGLKAQGAATANIGDTPFITDSDMTDWTPVGEISGLAQLRVYTFAKQLRLSEVLKEELKFIAHCPRLEADGRIGIVPLPRWTDATAVDALHTFDRDSIITKQDNYGMDPVYIPNRDGRVTMITLQQIFSFQDNDWIDTPVVVQEQSTTPITKGRGKQPMEIKPYSAPLFQGGRTVRQMLTDIAARHLAFHSITYGTVTFEAPWTKWGVLCGDIVSLTHDKILAGDGYRGVTGRRGVVIEKRVSLDPARAKRITFTVLLTPKGVCGYAPAAFITGSSTAGGNLYTVEADPSDQLNIAMAGDADGRVFDHFDVGDFIEMQQFDSYDPPVSRGQIVAKDVVNHTVSIQFEDDSWPGFVDEELAPQWIMEGARNATDGFASEWQRQFGYIADAVGILPDGGFGRRYS